MLVFEADQVYDYLKSRMPGLLRLESGVGIGWSRDGELVAGAVFEQHNGVCVWAHVAIDDGHLPRTFLRAFLAYPFKVCKVQAVRGYVEASNHRLRNLARRLGAVEEATLKQATPNGDVVICTLWRRNHVALAQN